MDRIILICGPCGNQVRFELKEGQKQYSRNCGNEDCGVKYSIDLDLMTYTRHSDGRVAELYTLY